MARTWEYRQTNAMAEAAEFMVWQTGGGCEAFGRNTPDESAYVLVSVEVYVDCDPDAEGWIVGMYDNVDGGFINTEERVTLPRALEIGTEWARFEGVDLTDTYHRSFADYQAATTYLRATFGKKEGTTP